MRLDKFRGWGPWLAYASPACFVLAIVSAVVALTFITPGTTPDHLPPGFVAMAVVAFVLMALWMLTMLAVAVDLEWIEHPLTHTGLTYVALGAAAVGTLSFTVSLLSNLLGLPDAVSNGLGVLWFAGVGVYLLLINHVGRQAQILAPPLAWIGIIAGAFQLLGAFVFLTAFAPLAVVSMLIFLLLYSVWSVWLGFTLRGRAPAAAGPVPQPA